MGRYTAHDAAIIVKKSTLLAYLKNYSFDVYVAQSGDLGRRKYYVKIDNNDILSQVAFKVDCKSEIVEMADYNFVNKFMEGKNVSSFKLNLHNDYIDEVNDVDEN